LTVGIFVDGCPQLRQRLDASIVGLGEKREPGILLCAHSTAHLLDHTPFTRRKPFREALELDPVGVRAKPPVKLDDLDCTFRQVVSPFGPSAVGIPSRRRV
jgi:hypothetical protein